MTEEVDWAKEVKDRITNLKEAAAEGERYYAFLCDRMGTLNQALFAIGKTEWKLHSIIPTVLPSHLSLDKATLFCVVVELEK